MYESHNTTLYNRQWVPDIRELLQNAFDGVRDLLPPAARFQQLYPKVLGLVGQGSHDPRLRVQLFTDKALTDWVFTVELWKSCIVLTQRMPRGTGLSRAALYYRSEKTFENGNTGGFGEGMKICCLKLLMEGYRVCYEMRGGADLLLVFFAKSNHPLHRAMGLVSRAV